MSESFAPERAPTAPGAGPAPGMRGRVGLFSIGLAAYWPQFPGLRERLEGYAAQVRARVEE